ncbi:MAG: hypothetical protein UIG59_01775 [Acutalibacteraceae bacterium]|nr:hypothetical protein [Acutalibacteraceae bacterium]
MKKAYIQPEIELLTVSALEDFLVASPAEGTAVVGGSEAGDTWLDDGDNYAPGNDDEWA